MNEPSDVKALAKGKSEWVRATVVQFHADFARPEHSHSETCLQIVLAGTFCETGWNGEGQFGQSEVLVRPRGFVHSNPRSPQASIGLSLQLSDSELPSQLAPHVDQLDPLRVQAPSLSPLTRQLSLELEQPDEYSSAAIEALTSEVLVHVLRSGHKDASTSADLALLERAERIVARSLGDAISVDQLSAELGVDRFRLNRMFLRQRGRSPSEFIRWARVQKAQALLVRSKLPLAEIAAECGFADQSHMSRVFSKLLGDTPGGFRKRGSV